MPRPSCLPIVLVGYPAVGKTTVALHAATFRAERGESTQVLHTDRLKVSARQLTVAPRGAAWRHDAETLRPVYGPLVDAHVDDAARKGLRLIVEGTLATFVTRPAHRIQLVCGDDALRFRAAQKPDTPRAAVAGMTDTERQRLTMWFTQFRATPIDAVAPAPAVAAAVDAWVQAAEESAP